MANRTQREAPKQGRMQEKHSSPTDKSDPRRSADREGERDVAIQDERRASGQFVTDGERTQVEEDFGERGLRTRGGPFDSERKPSILEEDADEDED